MNDEVAGAVFAFVTVVLLAGSVLAGIDAATRRDGLIGAFSVILLGLGAAMAYEVAALWTHRFATISNRTDLAYVGHAGVWLLVYACLMAVVGALSLHFTYSSRWHWSTLLVGGVAAGLGAAATVLTKWLP